MTLENTNTYNVTVCNIQTIDNEPDKITESGEGSLRCKEGKYYLSYQTDSGKVLIKLENGRVNVRRLGDYSSEIEYAEGVRTKLSYNTPYGRMEMETDTKRVEYKLSDDGGFIRLEYDLYAGGRIENKMEIKIEAK